MVGFFKKLFSSAPPAPQTIKYQDLAETTGELYGSQPSYQDSNYTGEKFFGGMPKIKILDMDYYALRAKSVELFTENLYARGAIRRYCTNIINTGLMVECKPEEEILGYAMGDLNEWSENVENYFGLWAKTKTVCDYEGLKTWYLKEDEIYREALIKGDLLVVIRYDDGNSMPSVQIVDGILVQSPIGNNDENIEWGVELDSRGRHVAFHILQDDGSTKRLPSYNNAGRLQAYMVYGVSDKLRDNVRGEPLLSILLQSLSEIDRYRDSTQRKAVINSLIAGFVKKGEDKMGSLPLSGGATSNQSTTITDATTTAKQRQYTLSQALPGLFMEELQTGEDIVTLGGQGTDTSFPVFEEAIIAALAWCLEVPPEIMRLAFSNNYSASQAAINEFKMFLNKERTRHGSQVSQPIFDEFFYACVINGMFLAPGYLSARNDPRELFTVTAWTCADWSGAIKPSVDIVKQAKGYGMLIDKGLITRDRASKEISGTKFSKNVKQLRKENEQLAEANAPLMEVKEEKEPNEPDDNGGSDNG